MAVASPFPANHGTPAGIRELARALVVAGHEVHVATYHFGDGEGHPPGVHVHRIADLGLRRQLVVGPTWDKPLLDLQLVFKLAAVVREQKCDLIHAHNYEGALVGFCAGLLTGRPVVYNAVNTMIDELSSYRFIRPKFVADALARALDYVVPRLCDSIIALSDELKAFLLGQGIPEARIHVIPLGVDCAEFDRADRGQARHQLGFGDAPLVVYTGILNRFQRVDYLIRAMSVVHRERADARLLLVANVVQADDRAACESLAAELGIGDRMTILESHSFSEIPGYLAAADVAVVPRPECPGFPVKLLNYLAAGRPVAVFAGSAKGLEDGVSAVVAPDHDHEALGRGILKLIQDRPLAERIGRAGRQFVDRKFAWPVLAERTADVYRRLL